MLDHSFTMAGGVLPGINFSRELTFGLRNYSDRFDISVEEIEALPVESDDGSEMLGSLLSAVGPANFVKIVWELYTKGVLELPAIG